MSSNMMTILGSINAMLGFALANFPDNTPYWAKLIVGSLVAGLGFMIGKTHPGMPGKGK